MKNELTKNVEVVYENGYWKVIISEGIAREIHNFEYEFDARAFLWEMETDDTEEEMYVQV